MHEKNTARSGDATFSKHRKQLRKYFFFRKKSREIEEECLYVDAALARGVSFPFYLFRSSSPTTKPPDMEGL